MSEKEVKKDTKKKPTQQVLTEDGTFSSFGLKQEEVKVK